MIRSRRKRRQSVDPACGSYAGKHKSVATSTTGQCRERAALPHSAQCQLRSQQRIRVNSRGFQCSLRFQVKAHSGFRRACQTYLRLSPPSARLAGVAQHHVCLPLKATQRAALLACCNGELRQAPGLGHMKKVALMNFSDRASERCT